MRVLIFSDSYPPEIRSASLLMQQLAKGLSQRGHEVSVCSLLPKYNLAEPIPATRSLFSDTMENGVRVLRVTSPPVHNTHLFTRGLGEFSLPFSFLGSSSFVKDPEIIIIYSPPLTLGLAAVLRKIWKKTPYIVNVQDLFPHHIIDAGILKHPFLIRWFKLMENIVYSSASKLVVHSDGNQQFLLNNFSSFNGKVEVIPNWVDTESFETTNSNNFRERWDLKGKFVCFFGGVIGYTQGLDVVVQAADLLKDVREIVFLLVGDGINKATLQGWVQEKGLANVLFHDFIPPAAYCSLLKEIDVGLLTLSPQVKTPVVPSKMLGFLAASRPVVASVNEQSDAIKIIEESGAGIRVSAGDPHGLAEAVVHLYQDKSLRKEMGKKGKAYATRNFSKNKCIDRYDELITKFAYKS